MARVAALLLDTGPIAALLDPADTAHPHARRLLDGYTGRLHTTSAVITEAAYLLSKSTHGPQRLAEFVIAGRVTVHDYAQPDRLVAATSLMAKYSDTPMDYADATLMLLAEDTGIHVAATFDRRGFSTFRTRRGKALRIFGD